MLKHHHFALGVCLSALLCAQQAAAQADSEVATAGVPAAEQGEDNALGEIVVTAQKRSENLQKVPIAIAAVNAMQLAQSGAQGTQGLATALPGLQILNIAGSVTPRVRGVGSGVTAAGLESPVATYVDGVYYAFGADVNMDLFDVEQVSLIKGPQGTLFGRNASGGVLQITTTEPKEDFAGRAALGFDEYETLKLDAFLTGGLAEGVAASVAASYTSQGQGWGQNLFTGNDTYKLDHSVSVRAKIRAELGDTTTIRLAGDFSDRSGPTSANFHPAPGTNTVYPAPQPRRLWDNNSWFDAVNDYHGGGASLTVDQEIGNLSFTSISAYRDAQSFFRFTPVPVPTRVAEISILDLSEQFTQELQLASDSNGAFTWQAGAFYFRNIASRENDLITYPGFAAAIAQTATGNPALGPIIYPYSRSDMFGQQKVDSIAAYAQATYRITDATRFTAGFRYTWQWNEFSGTQVLTRLDGARVIAAVADNEKDKFKKPTWRLALDHDFSPNVTGFVSYNRGVKSGGFNVGNLANPAYKPERLDAYEAGIKSELLDRRVRFNISGFYYKYANIQVPAFSTVLTIRNGASAELYGADVDLLAKATDNLTLNASANWLHARFLSFTGAAFSNQLPDGRPDLGFEGDASGNTVPYSPSLTYVVGATYTVPSSVGEFAINVNDSYNSGFYSEADNFLRQRGYHFLNASIGWTAANEQVKARIYVNNILNKAVASQLATINPFAYIADYTNPPRIAGASVEFQF